MLSTRHIPQLPFFLLSAYSPDSSQSSSLAIAQLQPRLLQAPMCLLDLPAPLPE